MSLFIADPDTLLREGLRELQLNTNITRFSPGAKAQAFMLAFNRQYQSAIRVFELGTALSLVYGATGKYLDFVGQIVGIYRGQPQKALADKSAKNMKFYTLADTFARINNGDPIPIPTGSRIYSEPAVDGTEISYYTTEDYLLPANVNYYFVSAQAAGTGSTYSVGTNVLLKHDVTSYTDFTNNTLMVTNVAPIENGIDEEDDDHYRFRIINNRLTGETANLTALRLVALSVPGVADVIIQKFVRGISTLDMIIQSATGYTSPDLITNVQEIVEDTVAYGISPLIRGPIETGIQLQLTVNYLRNTTIAQRQDIETTYLTNLRQHLIQKPISVALIINEMIDLFPIMEGVKSIGTPNKPFDVVYIFKPSKISDTNRVRNVLLTDYNTRYDEKIVPEASVESCLVIKRTGI